MYFAWSFPLLIQIALAQADHSLVEVNITDGPIVGIINKVENVNVHTFLGIPFAEPPVGRLRFRYPRKPQPWTEKRNCTQLPNSCAQTKGYMYDEINPAARMWLNNTPAVEDCLYLNVWTPEKPLGHLLPVMVWIYGGSFIQGSSTLAVYDGSVLAAKQSVVVVSIQYRLGPFGFLRLDNETYPGNQALMDQRMALLWIKDNIRYFGGDPDRVTLFGESSGAVSISLLAVSNLTSALFQRAILQSGSYKCRWAMDSIENAVLKARKLLDLLDCDIADPDLCLSSIYADKIISTFPTVAELDNERRHKHYLSLYGSTENDTFPSSLYFDVIFRPVIDNYFIPDSINSDVTIENLKGKQFLIGTNKNEASYFLLYGLMPVEKLKGHEFDFPPSLFFENSPIGKAGFNATRFLAGQVLEEKYMDPFHAILLAWEYRILNSQDQVDLFLKLDKLAGDIDFKLPTISFAAQLALSNISVYVYEFDYKTAAQTWPSWMGVMHGYEIEYIMGLPFSSEFEFNFYKFTENETSFSLFMMQFWANFVKFGDPNGDPSVKFVTGNHALYWKRFLPKSYENIVLKLPLSDMRMQKSPVMDRKYYWEELLPQLRDSVQNVIVTAGDVRAVMPSYFILISICILTLLIAWK